MLPRIPQPQAYLPFTDRRRFSRHTEFWQCRFQFAFGHDWKRGLDVSLLRSNSNQVAGRFLDPRERWRYLFVFVGLMLRRSAPLTITCPQTLYGLERDRLGMTIAFMSMVAAIIAERIQSGRVDKPRGEHCGTVNCERA